MYFNPGAAVSITRGILLLFLLIFLPSYFIAHAEDRSPRKPQSQRPLDPMNRPMDELLKAGLSRCVGLSGLFGFLLQLERQEKPPDHINQWVPAAQRSAPLRRTGLTWQAARGTRSA